jgi:hypothetical protein
MLNVHKLNQFIYAHLFTNYFRKFWEQHHPKVQTRWDLLCQNKNCSIINGNAFTLKESEKKVRVNNLYAIMTRYIQFTEYPFYISALNDLASILKIENIQL